MKRKMMILLTAACLILNTAGAAADSITLNGKTVPAETVQIFAPVSGETERVLAEEGQKIQAGDILYTVKTTKIYAERDGTVAGVFGQPGDDAEAVGARYGAVLYLEENPCFTVSASTSGAYNSLETKNVHTGETVYVICRTSTVRSGKGRITAVSGTGYTVEITEGEFLAGESAELFRSETYDYSQKIGRGTVSRSDPTAITASGAIVKIAVKDGDEVRRGDLLLETLAGTYDAYEMKGTEIPAGQAGVIGSIRAEAGTAMEKGSIAAEIYPLDRMRVEASIPEDYCSQIREGEPVTIELASDMTRSFPGTIVLISSVAQEGEEETAYRVEAEFIPDETVRFGMSAMITAGEEESTESPEEVYETEEEQEDKITEAGESGRKERRERLGGTAERNSEGKRQETPEGGSREKSAEEKPGTAEEAGIITDGEPQE